MLTAKEISDVVALLNKVEKASFDQWNDPKFVGKIRAEAFLLGMPLRFELNNFKVAVTSEE